MASDRRRLVTVGGAAVVIGLITGFVFGSQRAEELRNDSPRTEVETGHHGAGPSGDADGVPVGFAHTEDGAVAAAVNFHLLSGREDLDLEAMTKAMTMLAAPSWRSDAKAQAKTGYEYVVDTYGDGAKVRTAVLSHHLASFTENKAVVELWTVTVLSGNRRPNAEQVWGIVTIELAWVDDDWRIEGIESSPGASPVNLPSGNSNPTAAEVMEEFDAFEGAAVP